MTWCRHRPGGGAWTSPQFNFPHWLLTVLMVTGGTSQSADAGGAARVHGPDRDNLGVMSLGSTDWSDRVPARAPAPLPDGARFEERTYANEAGSRAYKLYVPSGYTGQPLPLVVMLHGCTQSPDDFAAGTQMNELAEEQTFLVAYPAQPQSANMSKCWNWFNAGDQQRDRGEPSLIAGITRQIMRDFPSIRGASLSPVSRPVAPRPPSWVRLTRTSMRPSACIPDWPAGRPGICPPPSPPCGRVGCQSLQVRRRPSRGRSDHRVPR